MALGALLTWYLIADATIITEGPQQALDIASQALDVAQNPKINNHFFAILLLSVMAKATLALSDFESTKIHLEKCNYYSPPVWFERFALKTVSSVRKILPGTRAYQIRTSKRLPYSSCQSVRKSVEYC